MLKWAEWYGRQIKGLLHIEVPHVPLQQPHSRTNSFRFFRQALAAHVEHPRRQVQADDINSGSSRRYQDSSGTAPHFEDGPARCPRGIDEEIDILTGSI